MLLVPCRTLQDLTTDTVITSVDATDKRSAFFFRSGRISFNRFAPEVLPSTTTTYDNMPPHTGFGTYNSPNELVRQSGW